MKKIIATIATLLATVAFLPSCADKETPEDDNPGGETVEEPVTLTLKFILPENGTKTAWVAGDEIIVHGEYAKDQKKVTLSAGDINGKTATVTVDGLYPYVREDCKSTLYAAWPAEAVDNLTHCFFYSKFSTTGRELMAACNDEQNNFQFEEVCGTLSFTLDDEYESFTISGNKKESLGYGFMQVKVTDNEQNYKQYVGDPILTLDIPAKKGLNTIYLPAGTEIQAGLMIKFRKDGDFRKSLKTTEPITIARAADVSLGNITSELSNYVNPFSSDVKDLDAEGNANCYIVNEPGTYKFKAVYGNISTNFIEDVSDADILWETWNDDSEVERFSVVASANYAEDYIIIKTPATLHPGNALVTARDDEGNILWSWQIWVPETAIQTGDFGGIMGGEMMDRNLGALVATTAEAAPVDPRSYGMVYQWGRKDPFTAAGAFNSGTPATYAYNIPEGLPEGEVPEGAEVVAPGQISLAQSIAHPTLLGHIDNGNWMNETDETLWSDDAKTLYDPCPVGYRVPPRASYPFWGSDLTAAEGWSIDSANGWLTIGNPVAVFPIAGYRDDYSVDGMAKVGVRTLYWNARGNEAKGYGADLRYDKGTYNGGGSAPKARLGSIRCVAE